MSNEALPLYLVDETSIIEQNDAAVRANTNLCKHVHMINMNLDFIDRVLRAHTHRTTDELMVLRLAVRCFNSGSAALRLARMGYYNQCLALIRDIMETTLLLDLFGRDPSSIREWTNASEKERNHKFGALRVRFRLEELDREGGGEPVDREKT